MNAPDIVPKLPPEFSGSWHVGEEQNFDLRNTTKASITCWHSMATYLSLVDFTQKPDQDCLPGAAAAVALVTRAVAAPVNDGASILTLISIASNSAKLKDAEDEAADRLFRYDGEQYPSDGCAITLPVLLQEAGIKVPDTFQAIVLGEVLKQRGWTQIPVGNQEAGDIGSTCGPTAHHGTDHIYLVLRRANSDEMVIADNQDTAPHFRWASGKGGTSPTRFFLRAPKPLA